MVTRVVIEGSPGSGKSSLLFGCSQQNIHGEQFHSLKAEGYSVIPESITTIAVELWHSGIEATDDMEDLLRRVLIREIETFNYSSRFDIAFFDMALPGIEYFAEQAGVQIAGYEEAIMDHRYDSPVFLLEPVPSFDMSRPRPELKGRVYTLEERRKIHGMIKTSYTRLGYEVLEVPIFFNNAQESNKARLDVVLANTPTQLISQ
jgi:predicted ATPase